MKEKASVERDRQAFWYNKKTGELIWLIQSGPRAVPGNRVGRIHTDQDGYQSRYLTLDKIQYKATHVIWIWMTGEWPKRTIDHKNRDSLDDRWENLREATQSQQMCNKGRNVRNSTGFKCVTFDKDRNKYTVRVKDLKGKYLRLGRFETPEEAYKVYQDRIKDIHGEFANSGI